ncbi:MAG: hypothetical protein DMF94_13395 [Acidobacteria bacterium]|nr:MAG: hypothetical protein DMF94_13395 [Acidobacteriota bacterium]
MFRIPVVRGRAFTARDTADAPGVIIINESTARRFWPTSDPLNDRLVVGRGIRPDYDVDPVRQIVGIVADVRDTGLIRNPRPAMYVRAGTRQCDSTQCKAAASGLGRADEGRPAQCRGRCRQRAPDSQRWAADVASEVDGRSRVGVHRAQ